MRTCTVTGEKFEPKTPEHFFASKEAFNLFIDEMDLLDQFVIEKRKINWDPIERACSECGEIFEATHPAMMYCTECKTNEDVKVKNPNDGRNPTKFYEPKIKECEECGRNFLATKPAMRYCEKCSDRGGEIVNN